MSRVPFSIGHLKRRPAQSGQAVIEILAGMIFFTLMIVLVMTISIYLYFQQALVTAAREGARQASLNSSLGVKTNEASGVNTVISYVKDEILHLTGQTYDPTSASITVIPPSQSANQTAGNRTVRVNIQWQMKNPIGVTNFFKMLGTDGSQFDKIPVYASATLRYEE